jgi:DedD protein
VKQRVVGALVLIALAAIIVPILLDIRKDAGVLEKPVDIPPKPQDFTVQVLPLIHPDKPDAAVPAAADQAQASSPPPPEPQAQTPAESPAERPVPPQAVTTATAPATSPSSDVDSPKAWAVQVGSFSSQDHAVALRDKLRAKRFTAYVERVTLDSGQSSYRVRVGPELLRSDAEKTQHRLQDEVKLSGIVVSH